MAEKLLGQSKVKLRRPDEPSESYGINLAPEDICIWDIVHKKYCEFRATVASRASRTSRGAAFSWQALWECSRSLCSIYN